MEVLFCSTTFFFDPLLALGDAAKRCASWGVFSLVTSFSGNDRAKCPDKPVIYSLAILVPESLHC
jgi:hypothetical protein